MASSENQVALRNLKQDGISQLVDPQHASKALSTDLVNLAKEVQKADSFVRANVGNKLQVIVEQIRFLQAQAEKVLGEAKRDNDIHHIACNCKKIPGNMYFMYERPGGQRYMSLISPQEWGSACPHPFIGAYRLENDMSWTPEEETKTRASDEALIEQILHNKRVLAIAQPEPAADAP
ncbi:uncharacterized protein C1orf50 homolog [Pollicipes pollicipes]|uniref:uncharacterized protein C1orf50 homolog n=1 Tax=Pollicipes pollicipes TaxID=41117 RepID=UPI001884F2DD|nr:uncharacterized protein C1orf50 homolog [Pollicipes pollicipes]XP_037079840.1 uncharacterized protein C1orf50 homolog [Pollicipes pollicipes]XP_037079841.1 uncharacterized protein C1orf50 homolog [Pollicipes pollicipes]